ncbi:MAG: metallophosphoesterase [Myxococcota bacterium]
MSAAGPIDRATLPERLAVVGDINGHDPLLEQLLFGVGLIDDQGGWSGGDAWLVQLGDVVNRGTSARAALERLLHLREQAREEGGEVVIVLGNHEVMTTLGHEAYVTSDEYMEFATSEELERYFEARTRHIYELLGPPDEPRKVEPIGGRIRSWEEENAPGKKAFREAFSAGGFLGQAIRQLPVAVRLGPLGFVHGGLAPSWAKLGPEGLQAEVQAAWDREPQAYHALEPQGIFRDPLGPLWHRLYCVSEVDAVEHDAHAAAETFGVERFIVGHTRTESVSGGRSGWPLLRQSGRVVMSDVGIGEPGEPGAALLVENGQIDWWSPIHGRGYLCAVEWPA